MLHFPLASSPFMSPLSAYTLPKRADSLNAPITDSQLLVTIGEELRDSRRVQRQGQEEDLREALSRMMARVEELVTCFLRPFWLVCILNGSHLQCNLLKTSYQTNSDIETSLTLAQSNLKLALANNEMLEDALKHNSSSKDVGWRRSSRDTAHPSLPPSQMSAKSQRPSLDEGDEQETHPSSSLDSPDLDNGPPSGLPPGTLSPSQDSRFFRFRFSSSGRSTPTQPHSPPTTHKSLLNSGRPSSASGSPNLGHLTSASLPSLLPATPSSKELEDLRAELDAERQKLQKIAGEKKSLEGELESLSQALFEEVSYKLNYVFHCQSPQLLMFPLICRQTKWLRQNALNALRLKKSLGRRTLRKRPFAQH
jgi:hypothetical protein